MTTAETMKGYLPKITKIILLAFAVLLPIIFSPTPLLTLPFLKSSFFILGVVAAFSLFLVAVLKDGSISLPKHWPLSLIILVPVAFLLSAIFSPVQGLSFVGYGFEVGTFFLVLMFFVELFLVSIMFRSSKDILYFHFLFLLSLLVMALLYGVRHVADFNVFRTNIIGPVGGFNDLAVVFSIGLLLSMVALETLSVNRIIRSILYVVFVLALLALAVVNFSIAWIAVGIFSLVWLVYNLSFGVSKTNRNVSLLAIVVLVLSVLFVLAGDSIGGFLSRTINISVTDVRPSWSSTFEVAKGTISENPIFGSGPNRFTNEWLTRKPDITNQTVFWNTDFGYGIGLLPTFAVTTGIVGTLAWLIFFGVFLYYGFIGLFAKPSSIIGKYAISSSFFAALFLWIFSFLYVPSLSVIVLMFFFTGLFFAALISEGIIHLKTIDFAKYPRVSFITTLVLVLILILNVSFGYFLGQKAVASVYFQKSLRTLNQDNNVMQAEELMLRAADYGDADIYLRSLVEIDLIRMNQVLRDAEAGRISEDVAPGMFQQALAAAIENGRRATQFDPYNYQNWVSLGNVYSALVPLRVPNAYENAVQAYDEARRVNPKSPALLLLRARLEATSGKINEAREFIRQALQMKSNYTEAIFVLSQIEAGAGNLADAIASVEVATTIAPNDAGLFFQLGLLRYNAESYAGAAKAFEQALALVPNYANAKYFLGLSYSELNRTTDALRVFEDLAKTNPDNQEINFIIMNLRSGRAPLENAAPPLDENPEDRDTLPLEETTTEE